MPPGGSFFALTLDNSSLLRDARSKVLLNSHISAKLRNWSK